MRAIVGKERRKGWGALRNEYAVRRSRRGFGQAAFRGDQDVRPAQHGAVRFGISPAGQRDALRIQQRAEGEKREAMEPGQRRLRIFPSRQDARAEHAAGRIGEGAEHAVRRIRRADQRKGRQKHRLTAAPELFGGEGRKHKARFGFSASHQLRDDPARRGFLLCAEIALRRVVPCPFANEQRAQRAGARVDGHHAGLQGFEDGFVLRQAQSARGGQIAEQERIQAACGHAPQGEQRVLRLSGGGGRAAKDKEHRAFHSMPPGFCWSGKGICGDDRTAQSAPAGGRIRCRIPCIILRARSYEWTLTADDFKKS